MADFTGMTEAVEGVRIYDIKVLPAPGAHLNVDKELVDAVKVTCKFEITPPAATRIFIKGQGTERCWFKPCGEKTGSGDLEGEFGMFSAGSASSITFRVFPPDAMDVMVIHTQPIDPPYVWEERELNEDEKARLAGNKLEQEKAEAEALAQRMEKVAELNRSPVPLTSLLGPTLLRDGEAVDTTAALANTRLVGIYFSAHWCGPCVRFTPKMAEIYNTARAADETFEMIFASWDKDQTGFDEYFATMPWFAMPFGSPEITAIKERWSVKYVPTLAILRGDGHLVTFEGVDIFEKNGVDAIQAWQSEA